MVLLLNVNLIIDFIEPQKPLVCETYSSYPPLGTFAVRYMKMDVAVGVIREINRKETGSDKITKAAQKAIKEESKKRKGKNI